MKKISVALILLVLAVATVAPMYAFAAEGSTLSTVEENIHLLNPVEIIYYDGKVFIADNVADNESVIHIFDVSGAQPKFVQTVDIGGTTLRLHTIEDTIYILQTDKYLTMETAGYSVSSHTISSPRIDMTVINGTQYIIKTEGLYNVIGEQDNSLHQFSGGISIIAIGNRGYFLGSGYYQYFNTDPSYGLGTRTEVDPTTKGILDISGEIATYSESSFTLGDKTIDVSENNSPVRDITANGNDLYVISDNKVLKWSRASVGEEYLKQANYVIGSDTVQLTPPDLSDITSYTQATALSYPANIIYKSTGADSIPNLIDNGQQKTFIILGYEGDSEDNYYYVFVDGAFGWIKKSAQQATDDKKIKITDTTVGTSVINYKSHFVTANAVFLYHLPCTVNDKEKFVRTKFTQTTDNRAEVTLLQQFTASDGTKWYYVKYTHNQTTNYGFVLTTDVGAIYSSSTTNEVTLDKDTPNLKVNCTLWDNTAMYMTETLEEDQQLIDQQSGEVIKLSSGTRVNVIERNAFSSYLQVVNDNGTFYYGWVSNDNLIAVNAPTTNTVVGLIIIAVAIALTITTVVVILRRKKMGERNPIIDIESNT